MCVQALMMNKPKTATLNLPDVSDVLHVHLFLHRSSILHFIYSISGNAVVCSVIKRGEFKGTERIILKSNYASRKSRRLVPSTRAVSRFNGDMKDQTQAAIGNHVNLRYVDFRIEPEFVVVQRKMTDRIL